MTAFLFPGQGSQKVGMSQALPRPDRLKQADQVLGFSLTEIIHNGPEEALRRTEIAQPAILAVSVAWADHLAAHGVQVTHAAGHSLGEYSALVIAGVLQFSDAVRAVHLRGKWMQEAVPEGLGAMAAIIGLDGDVVAAACQASAGDEVCEVANLNGAGQVVISGHRAAVERAMATCKSQGAKLVKALPVSAPFHCSLMKPAADKLARELETIPFLEPTIPVYSNVTAQPHGDANSIRTRLVEQATQPVRWEETMLALDAAGISQAFEVGPGAVLAGLLKRACPKISIQSAAEAPHG